MLYSFHTPFLSFPDMKHATAMSEVMVTAGALDGVVLNWPKANPLVSGITFVPLHLLFLVI